MVGEITTAELPVASGEGPFAPSPGAVPFDIFQTVISQYANSPIILQLIQNMQDYYDPNANFDAFYELIWNVDTAEGYGLDVWGRIVGVSRILQIPVATPYFGFTEQTEAQPFGQAPFYNGDTVTQSYSLSDEAYRRLILAKALANITAGSIPAINQILINLFPGYGNCYVTDGLDMTMTYTFGATLSAVDYAIVTQSGVLPRPSGVAATVVQL